MKVLVTGGAGFIGSHTVDILIEKGFDVRILDNLQQPVHLKGKPGYLNPKADFVLGDVRDEEVLKRCLKDIDIIFHFAAYQDYLPDFSTFFSVNSCGTALIYQLIVENDLPVKKVIVASSQAVMGEGKYECFEHGVFYPDIRSESKLQIGDWDIKCPNCIKIGQFRLSDESAINPQNQYAMSKYTQEMIAINLGKRYGIPSICLRYSIVQGPRQSFYNAYSGAMRIFSISLLQSSPPIIFEDGNQIRDYVNIKDVVDANLLVLEKDKADYGIYNVGGGKEISVNKFYEMVDEVYGTGLAPIRDGSYRYGDTRHIFSDISRLKNLGWEPTRSVQYSIKCYKEYLESQKDIVDSVRISLNRMKKLKVIRKARIET